MITGKGNGRRLTYRPISEYIMDTLQFETNIDTEDSLENLRMVLESQENIQYWYLDILKPDHLITVTGDDLSSEELIAKIKESGFEIKEVQE